MYSLNRRSSRLASFNSATSNVSDTRMLGRLVVHFSTVAGMSESQWAEVKVRELFKRLAALAREGVRL